MARMSIDDMFLRDPRVRRLAAAFGWTKYEARGRLLDVFAVVYDRVDAGSGELVTDVDVDEAAEQIGISERMVEFELAVRVRGKLRICGATERTKYLATRVESGRLGGVKSGETRRNKSKQTSKVTFTEIEAPANPSVTPIPTAAVTASADPDPTQPEKNSARPAGGGLLEIQEPSRKRKPKPGDATDTELASVRVVLDKLGSQNGVSYTGTNEHIRLIVNQLRANITEMDLRAVIGYCAVKQNWKNKPEMVDYLRPETLFGPKNISKYLDAARTWFATLPDDRKAQNSEGT